MVPFPFVNPHNTLSLYGLVINCGVGELGSPMAQGFHLSSLFSHSSCVTFSKSHALSELICKTATGE